MDSVHACVQTGGKPAFSDRELGAKSLDGGALRSFWVGCSHLGRVGGPRRGWSARTSPVVPSYPGVPIATPSAITNTLKSGLLGAACSTAGGQSWPAPQRLPAGSCLVSPFGVTARAAHAGQEPDNLPGVPSAAAQSGGRSVCGAPRVPAALFSVHPAEPARRSEMAPYSLETLPTALTAVPKDTAGLGWVVKGFL